MNNNDYFKFQDVCPVHGTEIKKEYDYGMADATVTTFHGCRCAVACDCERAWMKGTAYFSNYAAADGYARLVTAGNAAR